MGRVAHGWLAALTLVVGVASAIIADGWAATDGRRVALVIGNDDYRTLPDLNNAAGDARALAEKLAYLNFQVRTLTDASERDIVRALAEMQDDLADAEIGLIFFAGHGIHAQGRNYLVPADAVVEDEYDLSAEAVEESRFRKALADSGVPLRVLILDACRDNPLPRRSRSMARGLAVDEVTPPGLGGEVVLYSAGPGQAAQDGPRGGHGVFTGALLAALDQPGLTVEDVFKRTAREVARQTNRQQIPRIDATLLPDFVFRPGSSPTPRRETAPSSEQRDAGRSTTRDLELAFWNAIKNSTDPGVFEEYLRQFPDGTFAGLARRLIAALREDSEPSPRETSPQPSSDSADSSLRVAQAEEGALALNRSVLRDVQRTLSSLGFNPGGFDGIFRLATREAIEDFQDREGLSANGYLDRETYRKLRMAMETQSASNGSGQLAVGAYFRPGDTFRDCQDCPEMVVVLPGEFMMGSMDAKLVWAMAQGWDPEETAVSMPRHHVMIGYRFAVGRYEVTRREYAVFARETGRSGGNGCSYFTGYEWQTDYRLSWQNPGFHQRGRSPGRLCELGGCTGVHGLAEPEDAPRLSSSERGGMGVCDASGDVNALVAVKQLRHRKGELRV